MTSSPLRASGATLLVTLALALSIPAFAANEQLGQKSIVQIARYTNYAIIKFTPAQTNSQGCSSSDTDRVSIEWAVDKDGENQAALLFAAMIADKKVTFGISGCHQTLPEIYRVVYLAD